MGILPVHVLKMEAGGWIIHCRTVGGSGRRTCC